jgi:hypothetical protein
MAEARGQRWACPRGRQLTEWVDRCGGDEGGVGGGVLWTPTIRDSEGGVLWPEGKKKGKVHAMIGAHNTRRGGSLRKAAVVQFCVNLMVRWCSSNRARTRCKGGEKETLHGVVGAGMGRGGETQGQR